MFIQKKIFSIMLFFALILLTAVNINAQNNFEGKVKFKVSGGSSDESSMIDYYVKDDKIRMEVKDQMGAVIIFDATSVKMLLESQGMYMEYPRDMMLGNDMEEYESEEEDFKPTITNKTKDILGYECTQWIVDTEDGPVEMWVTDELGSFIPMQSPMGGGDIPEWQKEIADGNFFPMQVITEEDGEKVNAFEVVEVKKEDLDESLFTVPSGLRKMDMPFKMK